MSEVKWLTIAEVAKMLSVSTSTIRRYVKQQNFPQPMALSYRVKRYNKDEVAAWIASHQ